MSLSLSLVLKLTWGKAGHSPAATPAAARRHSSTRISVHSPETGQDTRASGPCIASGGPAGVAHFGGREGTAARAVWARHLHLPMRPSRGGLSREILGGPAVTSGCIVKRERPLMLQTGSGAETVPVC